MTRTFCIAWVLSALACPQVCSALDAPTCSAHPEFRAADFSIPVPHIRIDKGAGAKNVLDTLKSFGIGTLVRYYDFEDESIECKTLLRDETEALIHAGFSIAVIFQHNNDDPASFIDKDRGTTDAIRSLDLAAANGQPLDSTIYFGVDGPEVTLVNLKKEYALNHGQPMGADRVAELSSTASGKRFIMQYVEFMQYYKNTFGIVDRIDTKSLLPFIRSYFKKVIEVFKQRANGKPFYAIGGYGSGLVCGELLDAQLVSTCWLANATTWPGYRVFRDEKKSGVYRWSMVQQPPTQCPRWYNPHDTEIVEYDLNQVNPDRPNFGQWSRMEASVKTIARSPRCKDK